MLNALILLMRRSQEKCNSCELLTIQLQDSLRKRKKNAFQLFNCLKENEYRFPGKVNLCYKTYYITTNT